MEEGVFAEEIVPVPTFPDFDSLISEDIGPRRDASEEKLAKLKPYFDRKNGTVTVGNSSQVTDGAAALLVMSESEAKRRGLEPLGYMRDYAYAALEPERMGLGPAHATAALFERSGASMKDIDYIEVNEAFAAQILAVERAFASDQFARDELGRSSRLGEIDRDMFNIHGGAIAVGHPVGMTGARIVLHTLKELRRRRKSTGLASLCVGGGQGAALLLEVA
jgi:acetyl-CoA acetyltransferase family protein